MRLRTRDLRKVVHHTLYQDQFKTLVVGDCTTPPSWIRTFTGNYDLPTGIYESMLDVVTPGYNRRSSKGEVFFNPMVKRTMTIDPGFGSGGAYTRKLAYNCPSTTNYQNQYRMGAESGNEGRVLLSNFFAYAIDPSGLVVVPPSLFTSSEINELVSEASTACRASRGKATQNLWESVAEADQALGLHSDAFKQFENFTRKNAGVLGRAKAAGSAYLLYRYGIAPLMMDIQSAVDGMRKATGRVRQSSRGNTSANKNASSTSSIVPYGAYTTSLSINTTEKISVRTTWLDEYDATLVSNTGFTGKDLLTLPWELIPYSFVVDWFANVGDFINSLVPAFGLTSLGNCTVVEREIVTSVTSGSSVVVNPTLFALDSPPSPFGLSAKWTDKYRTPGVADPALIVKSDFRFNNLTRILDAISLTTQRIR